MDEIDFTENLPNDQEDEPKVEEPKEEQTSKQEELIIEAKGFIDFYKKNLAEALRDENSVFYINFQDLAEFSNVLSDEILVNPEETLRYIELAIEEMGLAKDVRVRLYNLSASQEIKVRNIRSRHLNELIVIEGIIRQASDVRPQVVNAKFECPSCGTVISVLQMEKKFREPTRCSCGRRGGFKLISKEMVDTQRLIVEEAPDMLSGGEQPKRINVFVKEDLVEPKMEEKTTPGARIKAIGILKEVPVPLSTGGLSTRFELAVEVNNIIPLEETFEELDISEEDEKQIQELAADPEAFHKLRDSIAPSVWGYKEIKESLLLQLFGGVQKKQTEGQKTRGDMHILMIGDPGVAKSVILGFMANISPKGRYVVGKSTSGAGLTATVVKDEYLKGWSLEAGAMVLANKGLVCIDELEKMDPTDRSAMHEAMEQQCYHYNTELQFADGSSKKIGDYVEKIFQKNKNKIIQGIDCEILDIKSKELLTTDFNKIKTITPQKISRHLAPKGYYKITYSNGRKIIVTPEHPIFIYKNNQIKEISASIVKKGMLIPAPRKTKVKGQKQKLIPIKMTHPNNKKINFPKVLDSSFAKLLGLHASEGHSYYNPKNRYAEIGISNTDKELNSEILRLFKNIFKTHINVNISKFQKRKNATKDLSTTRCSSIPLYKFFETNFPELLLKAPKKRIPQIIKKSTTIEKKAFLEGFFAGDGFIDSERCGFSTSSIKLAEDLQDLLLNLNIQSYIATEKRGLKKYYKVVVSGEESLKEFIRLVKDRRKERIQSFLTRSQQRANARDTIPYEFLIPFNDFLKKVHVSDGTITTLIQRKQNSHRKVCLKYLEKAKNKLKITKESYLIKLSKEFEQFLTSEIKFIKIKSVEKIKDKNQKWVYDVTVPPTKTFNIQGLVLHNTVTVSKANVQACYSDDTETLTEKGWKKYNEVKNLKIAQYNPKTNALQFSPHRGLYVYNSKGKLHHFKNKRNDILVTPNHKMLVKEYGGKEYQEMPAENIKYKRSQFRNSAEFEAKETKEFILPAIKHKQNRKHPKYTHQHKDKKIPMNLWLEFLGYYVTEGGIETIPTIGIVQKKGEQAEKIKNCMKKLTKLLGCSLSEIDCEKYIRFKITQTQLYEYLKNLGTHSYKKQLNLNFSKYSKKQLKILYDSLMLGDGHLDKSFSVTSEKLADEMQAIAHLIGKSASKNLHYIGKNRGNRKDAHRIVISNKTEPTIEKKFIKQISYKGKVYCFSTKTGFFVTRRNGKIAIQGNTLKAQTSVLAAANPKFGRFDPSQGIPQQIDLPPALINRFDVIFTMRDIPSKSNDEKVATHILEEHQKEAKVMIVERDLFRKYVAYAKQRCNPKLSNEAVQKMKEFYIGLRNRPMLEGQEMRTIPISARQLTSLIRMAEAASRLRLGETVDGKDADIAINLMKYYLMQAGYDEETGEIDMDKISGKIRSSQRNKIFMVRDAINKVRETVGEQVPVEEIEKTLEGKMTLDEIDDALDKLAKEGTIFRPRRGIVQKT